MNDYHMKCIHCEASLEGTDPRYPFHEAYRVPIAGTPYYLCVPCYEHSRHIGGVGALINEGFGHPVDDETLVGMEVAKEQQD